MSRSIILRMFVSALLVLSVLSGCNAPAAPTPLNTAPSAIPPSAGPINTPIPPPIIPTASMDNALVTKIDAAVEQAQLMYKVPGLAIGIVKNGQLVFAKGYGLAELGTNRPVTPETVFQLGSTSKIMVATAIMQLKEQDKIDLDAPVTTYLPYFQLADERYKQITIRQLLSHQSGLPCAVNPTDCENFYVQEYQSPKYDTGALEQSIRSLTSLKLNSAPGQQGSYSDLGFEILGDVIAKVSGQSFEDYTQAHIFTPLGMTHTSFMLKDISPDLLSAPHVLKGSQVVVNNYFPYSRQHAPSSNLMSNVNDMARFALASLNHGQLGNTRILSTAAYDEMWGKAYDINIPDNKYGLGWIISQLTGHQLIGHGGEDIGFQNAFILAPKDGIAVMIMTNQQYGDWGLLIQLEQWLLA